MPVHEYENGFILQLMVSHMSSWLVQELFNQDIVKYTKITPTQRLWAYLKFLNDINLSAQASTTSFNWRLWVVMVAIRFNGAKVQSN